MSTDTLPKEAATMNGRDVRTESLFDSWGIGYELEPDFDLSKIKIEDVSQVREETHRAPRSNVDQYAAQMSHGAKFPPIVVNRNGFLIDGNTRLAAAQKNGHTSFPAYVANIKQTDIMPLVGASLNQTGGQRLSAEEAQRAAEGMMRQGYDDSTIARWVGRTVTQVRNYRREREFKELAEQAELAPEQVESISKKVRRRLASINHVEPFKAAVEAVADKRVTSKDLNEIVEAATTARSDAEAVKQIETASKDLGAQGPQQAKRKRTRPTTADKFIRHAQAILALIDAGDLLEVLYEPDEDRQPDHREATCRLRDAMETLCKAYG